MVKNILDIIKKLPLYGFAILLYIKSLFERIKDLFISKEWVYFEETKYYDLSKLPYHLQGIKIPNNYSLTLVYKYCPKTKQLKYTNLKYKENWVEYTNTKSTDLADFIDSCNKSYTRDKKLKKLLK